MSTSKSTDLRSSQSSRSQAIQYEDLMKPEEDWRNLADVAERRKIQNRVAQRAYRRNMRDQTIEIERLKKEIQKLQETKDPKLSIPLTPEGNDQKTQDSKPSKTVTKPTTDGQSNTFPFLPPDNSFSTGNEKSSFHDFTHHCTEQPDDDSTTFSETALFSTFPWSPDSYHDQKDLALLGPDLRNEMHLQPDNNPREIESMGYTIAGSQASLGSGPTQSLGLRSGSDNQHENSELSPSTLLFEKSNSVEHGLGSLGHNGMLLHLAIEGGHTETLKLLLREAKVHIDEKDVAGYTPLQRAVMYGHNEMVTILLKHGAGLRPSSNGGNPEVDFK